MAQTPAPVSALVSMAQSAATDDPTTALVREAVEECRPMLQSDGGDIEFLGMAPGNWVKVRLVGACHGCPSSTMTLTMGIENYIKEKVPDVEGLIVEGPPAEAV
jgi:Fe-S cluster biogenesis protein NfuA